MTLPVCARPECGHTAEDHDGDGCCEDVPGTQDQKPRPECPCPSYRTQLQQELMDKIVACCESPSPMNRERRLLFRLLEVNL